MRKEDLFLFRGEGFSLDLREVELNIEAGEVQIGIRPEDLTIARQGSTGLLARVEMISNVGSEKYIHTRVGEERLTVRAPKEAALKVGEVVPLAIDPHRLHVFFQGQRI